MRRSGVPPTEAWRARGQHPRPQLQRAGWHSLDGVWEFAYDDGGGSHPKQVLFDREIRVPFPPESTASGIGDTGFHPVCWYRTQATIEPGPDRVILHFGAVDHDAVVWANGQRVVEHAGGHTPFSADITDAIGAAGDGGHFELVVRATDDPHDLSQPRGKQDWQERPHEIWYPRTTKTLDPTRPVVGNDGWEHVATDFVTIHDYASNPAVLRERYATPESVQLVLDRAQPGGRALTLAGFAAGTQPVVLSEFGGIAYMAEPVEGWGYSRVRSAEELASQYESVLRALHACRGSAGFCCTQLTDTFQERNGLATMAREPKVPAERIAHGARVRPRRRRARRSLRRRARASASGRHPRGSVSVVAIAVLT